MIETLENNITDEVSNYFRNLGFSVTWDFHKDQKWYEISKNGELLIQIDIGPPLQDILEDLKCFKEDRPTTSKSNYIISGPEENIRKFVNLLEL